MPVLPTVQDPHSGPEGHPGGGEEDGVRRAPGEHLGTHTHGQDCPLTAVQHA